MIAWRKTPELQDLNFQAADALDATEAARRRFICARDAVESEGSRAHTSDWSQLGSYSEYKAAESRLNDAEAAWRKAAQAAVDAIVPTLTDEERMIFDLLAESWKSPFPSHKEAFPTEKWAVLQEVDAHIAVPKSAKGEFWNRLNSNPNEFDIYRYVTENATYIVYRVSTVDDVRGYETKNIGLKDAVKCSGLSLADVARAVGISRTHLSQIVNGHAELEDVKAATLKRLANVLDVRMEDLLV